MKQETLDRLARLDYQDEKAHIKRLKKELECIAAYPMCKDTATNLLRYHKNRLVYIKRRVPMKPKEYKNYQGLLYICPCCDCELFYDHVEAIEIHKRYSTYCGRCGQRLMWE